MGTLSEIADKKNCGGANSDINTGKLGCLIEFGTPEHAIRLPKRYKIPASTDINLEWLTELVQKGIAIPIIGASNFEDVSAENNYSQNASQEKRLNIDGLPEYRLTFEEGHEFYKNLAKLKGYKNADFIIIDEEGRWLLARYGDNFSGMSAGHVTPELTKRKVKGGDAEMKALLIQFLNRMEWDLNYSILQREEVGMLPEEIPTVNGVEFSFNAIPAATDTVVEVGVVLQSDRETLVEGFNENQIGVLVNGVAATITGVTESTPSNYNITIDTALEEDDTVQVVTWDSDLSVYIAEASGELFRGMSVIEDTIAA